MIGFKLVHLKFNSFPWGDAPSIRTGLSDAGLAKTELVIPAKCQGFSGTLLIPGLSQTKSIVFEGTDHIDLAKCSALRKLWRKLFFLHSRNISPSVDSADAML